MKKVFTILLAAAISMSMMVGCGSSGSTSSGTASGAASTENASVGGTATSSDVKWPTGPVEAVVTASAGGDTDFNARTFATYFEKITGQPMIVTNMAGGGGSIATSAVKDAKADGSKILFCHTGQMIVNEVAGLIDYNMDSFDVSCIPAIDKGTVLVASKKSGITSVEDLIKKAKAAPGKIVYGSELGGYSNLQGLILCKLAGVDLKIVDTGSTSEKVTSLLSGRIDLGAISYGSVKDYQQTGDMVILAQFNKERNEFLGDIPTFKEGGIDFAMEKPYIISFPKGTDPKIIAKMNDISKQIVAMPEYAKKLEDGFKQPVDRLDTADAVTLLKQTREEFMGYKDMLAKKK